ncbi:MULTISPECIES: GNAT family N-acetyltransferase [Butyricimonas]|uniref:GNAT family N-acetyltransferase n=1 Tax=Butyricimonas hominis TaxID=2763032 RepID=A0ABR7D037_9BACT|nr:MULTISPECIES: GNAT family N-acetyltransferase [Butyricimonas]MBC5620775.1 GNAT family N-acetyltransferase [Butyricimonas hominis]MCB6970962.1 GNAT family N-acetyltransferase [Butyricimonas synergistica]MCG4517676.1 GNAT family N-acetyltransferase [Butyricimonas sp. DFI.6.44]
MMNLIRITEPGDIRLQRLIPLYEEAFPENERRDIKQLQRLILEKPEMHFNAIECDDTLAGLFIYWDLHDFYYMEHLAVFSQMRNLKVGQQVLDYITEHLSGLRLLEVEPTMDEMTTRRVKYYERNGYEILDKSYIQPSYRDERDAGNLWIMGNHRTERLQEFIERIKQVIYRDNYR